MALNLNEIEALISRAKRRPLSTLLAVSAIVVALATGAWITSFFGEMGKHHATPQESNPKPANKTLENTEKGEMSSRTRKVAPTDEEQHLTHPIPRRSNTEISETLNRILENQRDILERLRYLENKMSSASFDFAKIDTEIAQVSPLLDETVSFLSPEGRLSKELDQLVAQAEFEYKKSLEDSNTPRLKAPMWENQLKKTLKLRNEIDEKHTQAVILSRDFDESREVIQALLQLGKTASV